MDDVWGGPKPTLKFLVALIATVAAACVWAIPALAHKGHRITGHAASGTSDVCGYPNASFVESTVMRWAQVNGTGSGAQIVAFANDEWGLLLGIGNTVTPNMSSPQHVSGASGGDAGAKDANGRVYFPALYITNLTAHPSGNPGDFQNGGQPRNVSGGQAFVNDIFGTWATGSLSGGNYSAVPPAGNNGWNLGTGSDQPTISGGFSALGDEGHGSEVRWNVSTLTDSDGQPLQPGNTYRVQILTHDGDQYHTAAGAGGDAGEYCARLLIPGIQTTAVTGTTVGQPVTDQAVLKGSGGSSGTMTWNVYSGSDTRCTSSLFSGSAPITGDGAVTSPAFTPTQAGTYKWVARFSGTSPTVNISGGCSDANEVSVVNKAAPQFNTTAVNGTAGQPVHDIAHLLGGYRPTGQITWSVYSGADTTCASPLFTSSAVNVNGAADYMSPDWTPTSSGNYQWVASYAGDLNNTAQTSGCGNEPFTVQPAPAPSMQVIKLESFSPSGGFGPGPITGQVGQTVYYQMDLINTGNTDLRVALADPGCDSGTLQGPSVLTGTFNSASNTLSTGGELQWTCSHVLTAGDVAGYTNTATGTGTPPPNQGSAQSGSSSVIAYSNTPGMTVTKLQRDGSTGGFTTSQITGSVGDTINYEIQVSNTGNVPLTISLSDPHCDAGTIAGPSAVSGTLNGNVLAAGGVAQYTCSHVLAVGDIPTYTNTGTVTGQPPSGNPLTGTGIVTTNVTQAAIKVLKLQSLSSTGPFSANTLTVQVGQTIYYQIQATNTGNAPLTLSISDPMCDAGTIAGPSAVSGTLNGNVLAAGGVAQYTCSHLLTAGDPSPFTNTASITGTPPSGPPVSASSSVSATKQSVLAKKVKRCPPGTIKKTKRNKKGKKIVVCKAKRLSRRPVKITGFTG